MFEDAAWPQFVAGLEAADFCGIVVAPTTNAILWCSRDFAEFAGMTPLGVCGTRISELFAGTFLDVAGEIGDTGRLREYPVEVLTADRGLCRAVVDLNTTRFGDDELIVVKVHVSRVGAEQLGTDWQVRALVDTLPAPALIWRPDTYEILYVNKPMEDIWGFPRGNVLGRRVDEFVQNLSELRRQIEKRLRGAPYSPAEFEIKDGLGRDRVWVGSSTVVAYEGAQALITAVTDVTEREEIERALRQSEQNYSLVVENVPEGIVVHCEGRVVFANPVALEMSGYGSFDEMRDLPVIELIHPDDRPVVAERMRTIIADRLTVDPMHERVVHRNGSWLDVEITGAPTEFEGKPAALIVARDISERLSREAALRDSEAKYRTLVESVNDTIFQLDAAGRFIFMSGMGNSGGLMPVSDVVGRAFAEFIHPADLAALRESYKKTLEGQLEPHEFRVKGRNGEWRYVRTSSRPILAADGAVTGLIGVMVDLTERIAQEKALRESAAKLEEAHRIAGISTWEINPATGQWTMSGEVYDAFGLQDVPDTERQRAFSSMVHPEDMAAVQAKMLEAFERTDDYEAEYRCILPDGEIRHVRSVGHVERREDGTARRMYGAMQDVTDRKRQEEERLQIEVQLQRAQSLDSLTVLAGGVAHDFNNLLTGILGYTELLRNVVGENLKAHHYLNEAQTITRRAADLTRQLLAYSGRGKFDVKALDLGTLLADFAPLLEAVVPKDVEMVIEAAPGMPSVKADSAQLRQVLMNLVINASESIEDGHGRIRVGARIRSVEAELPFDANHPLPAAPGDYAVIEVADNGIGMAEYQLKRVCDPFYSTKFVGRGLGLSAVHGIVQSHNGGLHIASEPGCGTTVEIFLPLNRAGVASLTPMAAAATGSKTGNGPMHTVLVVDDDETVRSVATDMLKAGGFRVLQACDGEECLQVVSSNVTAVDLVLLDLTMPRLNGEQTLHRLRDLRPTMPVILATGYSEQDMRERFADDAPEAMLQKPFNSTQLLERVRAELAGPVQ